MTLATEVPSPVFTPVLAREATARRIPALRTERLVLRALCQRDVPVIVQLAGDRRVAENTARIPHPYSADAAEQFVAQANRQNDSATFAITLNGSPIGACGIDDRERLLMPRLVLVGRLVLRVEEGVVPVTLAVVGRQGVAGLGAVVRIPTLDKRVADIEERGLHAHANIVSTVLDFEQLAFIEKWRQRASRGVVIALDGTRGDIVVTMRAGELGERLDVRGKDATGAVRKARLAIGDRVTMAIEYSAKDVSAGAGTSVSGDLVAPGAVVEGTVSATGDITVVDCGIALLVKGETLPASVGDIVRFTIADEGRAYLIPTR